MLALRILASRPSYEGILPWLVLKGQAQRRRGHGWHLRSHTGERRQRKGIFSRSRWSRSRCVLLEFSTDTRQPTSLRQTFTGRPPFDINYHSAILEIMNGKRPRRPGTLSHDGLWKFVQRCWNQDPVKRPTALELVKFFQES